MTVKELAKVMGEQFIAVGRKGRCISYSGKAADFKSYLENEKVIEVIAPKSVRDAMIIYVA